MKRAAPLLCAALILTNCGSGKHAEPGRHLVFTDGVGIPSQAVWIADAGGRHARRLIAPAGFGFVAPDGRRVAFDRRFGRDIYVIDSDGSNEHLVVRKARLLDWLPDSERLLALRGHALITVDAGDGRITTLDPEAASGKTAYGGWSFAPDGRSIVYGRSTNRALGDFCFDGSDIYVVGLDGGRPRPLLRDGRSSVPVWGPTWITFRRDPSGCSAGGIWRIRPDGSGLAPVLARPPSRYTRAGPYGLEPVAWSSRGLVIGVRTEWGVDAALLRNGRIRELGLQVDRASRDGNYLVGAQGGAEFPFTIAIASVGGKPRTVARGRVCCPDWNR
jgi:hypothetical protein